MRDAQDLFRSCRHGLILPRCRLVYFLTILRVPSGEPRATRINSHALCGSPYASIRLGQMSFQSQERMITLATGEV